MSFLLLLILPLPQPGERHHYDHAEVNQIYFYSTEHEDWKPQFKQVLLIDYVRIKGVDVKMVNDWRLYKDNMAPRRDFATGKYVLRFLDRGDRYREIFVDSVDYTSTDHDPEFLNREVWPVDGRRTLERATIKKEMP